MLLLLLISIAGYVGLTIFLLCQAGSTKINNQSVWQPFISIIVAARNEGDKISACLSALVNLTYPREKTEIIIVNDDSNDLTESIILDFAARFQHIQSITLQQEQKLLPGKAGAVLAGIEKSRGEIIFLTDADCRPLPTWIETLIRKFTPSIGLVGGFTLLNEENHQAAYFQKSQALDYLYLLTIAAIASDIGKPLSWMGNNLAFRRSAYDQVGGYRALKYSLIEDFALIDAMARKTHWQIRFFADPQAVVYSQPVSSIRHLYNQRKRWAMGIRWVRPFGKVLLVCSFLAHALVLLTLPFHFIYAILAALAMFVADFGLCWINAIRLNRRDLLLYFPGFEVLYFGYSIILPLSLMLSSRIAWKNNTYGKNP